MKTTQVSLVKRLSIAIGLTLSFGNIIAVSPSFAQQSSNIQNIQKKCSVGETNTNTGACIKIKKICPTGQVGIPNGSCIRDFSDERNFRSPVITPPVDTGLQQSGQIQIRPGN